MNCIMSDYEDVKFQWKTRYAYSLFVCFFLKKKMFCFVFLHNSPVKRYILYRIVLVGDQVSLSVSELTGMFLRPEYSEIRQKWLTVLY